jgi:nucleotide-binding universal stress UspA family protein
MHVSGIGPQKTTYLMLDELTADPELAQRLSPELAWRFHALPLAEDRGRVTVAMADPDDAEARAAVVAALGPEACVVRGTAWSIDAQLAEIWGDKSGHCLEIKVCAFPEPIQEELWAFAQALAAQLGAHLDRVNAPGEVKALVKAEAEPHCDLVILGEGDRALVQRLLSRSTVEGVLPSGPSPVPFATLVAQQPRWPIERILLVIWGTGADDAALDWALRLARARPAVVTVLAIVPAVPVMYRGLSRMEQSLAGLLTTDTPLGRQMRQVARRLTCCKVDANLRLRQGAPDQQICRELVEGNHDLIVMATKPCHWWLRQLQGDPICSLLNRIDRPLLLAEPVAA